MHTNGAGAQDGNSSPVKNIGDHGARKRKDAGAERREMKQTKLKGKRRRAKGSGERGGKEDEREQRDETGRRTRLVSFIYSHLLPVFSYFLCIFPHFLFAAFFHIYF